MKDMCHAYIALAVKSVQLLRIHCMLTVQHDEDAMIQCGWKILSVLKKNIWQFYYRYKTKRRLSKSKRRYQEDDCPFAGKMIVSRFASFIVSFVIKVFCVQTIAVLEV